MLETENASKKKNNKLNISSTRDNNAFTGWFSCSQPKDSL